ncbi:MAG: hypothetical protein ABH871_06190 [Pseudomonadota bacterium]
MWRIEIAILVAMSICSYSLKSYAIQRKPQFFVEPSRSMGFEIPYGWQAQAGFGNSIADLSDGKGNQIRVISRAHSKGPNADNIKQLIAKLYSGARIRRQNALITLFDVDARGGLRGALIRLGTDACDVNILCISAKSDFAETFLVARELAANMRCDLAADPSLWDGDLQQVIARATFASLDGRAGCSGVSEELTRMALIAKQLGKLSDAKQLESIAHDLSLRAHMKGMQKNLSFFSLLMSASLALDEGDIDKAKKLMRRVEPFNASRSQLFLSLKVKIARLENDVAYAEQAFEQIKGDVCGRSGAMAAYELGRAIGAADSGRAIKLFEDSIEADPTFVPAYVALGQMLVDSGMPATAVSARMNARLSKAPKVPEVQSFKMRFATVEKSVHP